jgi:hypothetical protein
MLGDLGPGPPDAPRAQKVALRTSPSDGREDAHGIPRGHRKPSGPLRDFELVAQFSMAAGVTTRSRRARKFSTRTRTTSRK